MIVIAEPLAVAVIVFSLCAAAIRLFQYADFQTDEMEAKMVFRLLLGPLCLAVLVLVVDGISDRLSLISWLRP